MYERIKKSISILGWQTLKSVVNLMHPLECKKCKSEYYLARTGKGTKEVSKVGDNWRRHTEVCIK